MPFDIKKQELEDRRVVQRIIQVQKKINLLLNADGLEKIDGVYINKLYNYFHDLKDKYTK